MSSEAEQLDNLKIVLAFSCFTQQQTFILRWALKYAITNNCYNFEDTKEAKHLLAMTKKLFK